MEGVRLYGQNWREVAGHVGTRNVIQVRTHSQKFGDVAVPGASEPGSEMDECVAVRRPAVAIVLPPPVPSAIAGPRALAHPLYYGGPGDEATGDDFDELDEEGDHGSIDFSGERAALSNAPQLGGLSGLPRSRSGPALDLLQPWPVPRLAQRVTEEWWSATNIFAATVDPDDAAALLGLADDGSLAVDRGKDPAFALPPRGPSWLLHQVCAYSPLRPWPLCLAKYAICKDNV